MGTSPYGQAYVIVLRKEPKDPADAASTPTPRAIIYESGSPIASALERSGIQGTDEQMLGFKTRVALDTQTAHKRLAAVVMKGTRTATNPSWTLNLTNWLAANLTDTAVTALVGFNYLEPDGGEGSGTPVAFSGECKILRADQQCFNGGVPTTNCINPSSTWSERSCTVLGAGYQKIDAFPACAGSGISFRATPVGQLSFNEGFENRTVQGQCYNPCSGTYPCNLDGARAQGSTWQTDHTFQDIRVNDASIAKMTCIDWVDTNGQVNPYGGAVCGYTRFERP